MNDTQKIAIPSPVLDAKEEKTLDQLTERYEKLVRPGKISQLGKKATKLIPEPVRKMGHEISVTVAEQELYAQMMGIVANGFKTIEEQAAKFSINEDAVVKKVNQCVDGYKIEKLEEICLVRSYELEKLVSQYKSQDLLAAIVEGGGTGAFGFWGLPFNLVLSTFLYFRAVQSIAMFYGYDVKNDSTEMVIASQVFTNALSPANSDANNEVTTLIEKVMIMSKAAVIKQSSKKGWAEMASRGGVPLLLTQMRALAHKAAKNALEKAGQKGLENSLFKEAFEQIGRKLTLKAVGKAIPVASAVIGAMLDTAQMSKVLEFADVFYQKRYIIEKESRIYQLLGNDIAAEAEIIE